MVFLFVFICASGTASYAPCSLFGASLKLKLSQSRVASLSSELLVCQVSCHAVWS